MKLTDLLLNRWLYKVPQQDIETKDAVYDSANVIPAAIPPLPAGGAAQDINTSNVTINGGQITPGTLILQVGDWGWGQTCAFSSTDLDTVAWTGGTFKTAYGIIYTISAGTTDARLTAAGLTSPMNAKVYIYLDLNLSSTLYHCTYTPADSVGLGKVLVAVAQNAAIQIPQPLATFNLTEANQIVGDNILANTINAGKLSVGQLSAITADLGAITAGTITLDTVGYFRSGQTDYNTGTGFFLGNSGGAHKFSMGNGSTKAFTYDGTDFSLVGGTISGGTIQTTSSTSTNRVIISGANNDIEFWSAANARTAYIIPFTAANVIGVSMATNSGQSAITVTEVFGTANISINTSGGGGAYSNIYLTPAGITIHGDTTFDNGITLGGVYRTSWATGVTALSGLSIDTSKNWGGYDITNFGSLIPGSGTTNLGNSTYRWNNLYLYPATTDVSADGQFHYYNTGGVQELQIYMAGFGYSCDLSFL